MGLKEEALGNEISEEVVKEEISVFTDLNFGIFMCILD